MKTTFFNRYEDTVWPPQCHNFDSTAGAGGFTAGAAAPAVNMLEEALHGAPSKPLPKIENSSDLVHYSLGGAQNNEQEKNIRLRGPILDLRAYRVEGNWIPFPDNKDIKARTPVIRNVNCVPRHPLPYLVGCIWFDFQSFPALNSLSAGPPKFQSKFGVTHIAALQSPRCYSVYILGFCE